MYPIGDSALQIKWTNANAHFLRQVSNLIQQNHVTGVYDMVPGLETITLFYHFPQTTYDELAEKLANILKSGKKKDSHTMKRTLHIPTLYEGPDFHEVDQINNTTPEIIIQTHSSQTYEVTMLGFLPGFPYLSGLPASLHTPRRTDPRLTVDAGAVGIGGASTGIYPIASPGGWNLIGRTPIALFSLDEENPFLFQQGDKVKFVPITNEQWETVKTNREEIIFYEKN